MIAVIFEVFPETKHKQRYLDIAAALRPELEQIDGFISVERFQSLTDPSKLLSLSFFRDEQAIAAWRALAQHRNAQSAGRGGVFADYRLRVAGVMRDYGMFDRDQAPGDSRTTHDADSRTMHDADSRTVHGADSGTMHDADSRSADGSDSPAAPDAAGRSHR